MAENCAREVDERVIDLLQKSRVQYPQRLLATEILTLYRFGNLGRQKLVSFSLCQIND